MECGPTAGSPPGGNPPGFTNCKRDQNKELAMKRLMTAMLLAGALLMTTGCDDLEEINIDLGSLGGLVGYGGYATGGYYHSDPVVYEEVWIEEEYIADEYYTAYEEDYYYDDWYDQGWW